MIEVRMVGRMIKRASFAAPLVAVILFLWGGPPYALSGLAGLFFAVANLWFSARLIGRTADRDPQMLMVAGMAALFTTLIVLTAVGLLVRHLELVSLPVFGVTLIGSHLALVLWETATSPLDPEDPTLERRTEARTRS